MVEEIVLYQNFKRKEKGYIKEVFFFYLILWIKPSCLNPLDYTLRVKLYMEQCTYCKQKKKFFLFQQNSSHQLIITLYRNSCTITANGIARRTTWCLYSCG